MEEIYKPLVGYKSTIRFIPTTYQRNPFTVFYWVDNKAKKRNERQKKLERIFKDDI